MNCEFSSTYSVTWKVFSARDGNSYEDVNRTDNSLLLSNSMFTFLRSNHELGISCCVLPYGILSVSVDVHVTGNVLVESFKATKILNTFIGHTPPVAMLESSAYRIYGYNTMVLSKLFHIPHIILCYSCLLSKSISNDIELFSMKGHLFPLWFLSIDTIIPLTINFSFLNFQLIQFNLLSYAGPK